MNSKKVMNLLFIQNIITGILLVIFFHEYKTKIPNDIIVSIVCFVYFVPTMASIFLLTSGWLINEPAVTVSIGVTKDASIYENLGKLLVAETTIIGTSKLDFISKNVKTLASTVGVKEKDIWILYSELAILHGEYLKKKSESATDQIGYK